MQFEGLQKNMYRLKTPLELTCQLLRAVTYSVTWCMKTLVPKQKGGGLVEQTVACH